MKISSGVFQDKNLSRQFFSRHHEVFPFLNLEKAIAEGFIGSNIETFSLLDQAEKTCAILIITPMTIRIGERLFQTVQIGGMATSPQRRDKGFGGQLLSHVVDLYLPKIDFLFLFAHRGVVEFYPR